MQLTISFKHMNPSDTLKAFVEEKSQNFKKYFRGNVHATWTVSSEKTEKVAHCHLVGNNMDYFGEGKTEDFKASIELAFEKIEKQIRKHKEIVKDHHPQGE